MPPRRCGRCRQLVGAGVRCPCAPGTRSGYGSAEIRRRRQCVQEHLETYGPLCPGWRREQHDVHPAALTADHVVAVAAGGDPHGQLQVLCRSCNSRKGARTH